VSEITGIAEVVLPLRGFFVYQLGAERCVADPRSAFVIGAGQEYRVGHPVDGGDECALLLVPPELIEEAFGDVGTTHGRLSASTQLAASRLASVAWNEPLAAEEAALDVLRAVARDLHLELRHGAGVGETRRVRAVRALLASAPSRGWRLAELARHAGCSPYHLARLFRAETGEGIHRHLVRQRLSIALARLREGETDLTALALDLGFSHHSHFTASFRAMFGVTPAAARKTMRARSAA
jgi:AraC-like DNA-binding protein